VSALHRARSTGTAQHADVAMLDVQVSMLSYQMALHLATGLVPTLQGRAHSGIPEMGAYECKDGIEVLIAPLAAHMWPWLCKALELEELEKDPNLATRAARIEHRATLKSKLQAVFLTRTSDEWVERMRAAGVPIAAVNDFKKVIDDPQIQHRKLVADVTYDGIPTRLIGSPMKFSGAEQHYDAPPTLDSHGHAILKNDLGLSDDQIDALRREVT
jgi:crotonobetainyl-CoA:carnitine CoA-transferase CaiB-like acyl-CoA transferase